MTTKTRKRKKNQYNSLKALFTIGSLAATLVGARMLAAQEEGQVIANTAVSTTTTITTNIETLPLPPNRSSGGVVTLNLQPIPRAASPIIIRPVARTRSSG